MSSHCTQHQSLTLPRWTEFSFQSPYGSPPNLETTIPTLNRPDLAIGIPSPRSHSNASTISDSRCDDEIDSGEGSDDNSRKVRATAPKISDNWYEVLLLVNYVKYHATIYNLLQIRDFGQLQSFPLSQGTHFHVRVVPEYKCVAKYPIMNSSEENFGMSRKDYKPLSLELRILSHGFISQHPNIVDLLGIGWARAQTSYFPVLYLEYASPGTIADYLHDNSLCPYAKNVMAGHVVAGLRALHKCGITHGDLKFENVLIFRRDDGSMVAKLADFGCAVIEGEEEATILLGGTPPWNAPEWRESIEPSLVHKTDLYSLGLLIWRLTLDGRNPFEGEELQGIENRKIADVIVDEAVLSVEQHYDNLLLSKSMMSDKCRFELYLNCVAMPRKIFQHTLRFSCLNRDLDPVSKILAGGRTYSSSSSGAEETIGTPPEKMSIETKYPLSWMRLTDLPNDAKKMFLDRLKSITENRCHGSDERGKACLQLCWAHIDGWGVVPNNKAALDWAIKAARLDNFLAQGTIKRLHDAYRIPVDESLRDEMLAWLYRATTRCHTIARDDFQKLDYSLYTVADNIWKGSLGCRLHGAKEMISFEDVNRHFDPHHWPNLDQPPLKNCVSTTFLSGRMNTLLHAASVAAVDLLNLEAYLEKCKPDVNPRDARGNTPLLLAMRCGHSDHAQLLLRSGADASIANNFGQTPCHWLISIEASAKRDHLLRLLLQHGADLTALSDESLLDLHEYSVHHGGSPLHWAVQRGDDGLVRELLTHGADPELLHNSFTPIDIAVQRYMPNVLRQLLSAAHRPIRSGQVQANVSASRISESSKSLLSENYINYAVKCYPLHDRLICLGGDHADSLRRTIEVLQAEGLAVDTRTSPIRITARLYTPDTSIIEVLTNTGYPTQVEDLGVFWRDMLLDCIYQGHPIMLKFLLQKAIHTSRHNILSQPEELLLHAAMSLHADVSVVQNILDTGVDINARDAEGKSALVFAVDSRNYDIATHLLKQGADVNILRPIKMHWTTATPSGSILYEHILSDMDLALGPLEYLLRPLHLYHDQIPNFIVVPGEHRTALHLACIGGNRLVFKFLLQIFHEGVHLNYRDKYGFTALHIAVFYGQYDFVKSLHGAGADIDPKTEPSESAELKVDTAMDICFWKLTPSELRFANSKDREECLMNRLHILEYLQHHGAQRSAQKLMSMELHLKLAYVAVHEGMTALLKSCLLRVKIYSPVRQPLLDALLFLATRLGQTAIMRHLLLMGANLETRSKTGRVVLHYAALKGDVEGVQLLVLSNAQINVLDICGWNPTSLARLRQYFGVYKLLNERGGELIFPKRTSGDISEGMNTPLSFRDDKANGYENEEDWEDINNDGFANELAAYLLFLEQAGKTSPKRLRKQVSRRRDKKPGLNTLGRSDYESESESDWENEDEDEDEDEVMKKI